MPRVLRSWFETLTDVRREEVRALVLMIVYGFLAMTSYYVVKPVRNAVFVDRVGADNLPYVYILTAIIVSVIMVAYSRWVHRIGHKTLLLGTFAFLASNLLAFRWLLLLEDDIVVSGAFYIWGKLYPLLIVSQFWLVGNLLWTTRQAKRLFGPIGLGLILGGIAGSSVAGWATEHLGSENLLLAAAAMLGVCAGIVVLLDRDIGRGETGEARLVGKLSKDAVRLLTESPNLRMISAILMLTILVSTLVDWQLNQAVEAAIPGEDAKTVFYGRFFLLLNVVSVIIQVLLTSFVLGRFGVGVGLLVLPLSLLAASVGIFLVPILLTAALAKGAEQAIRYSLDQSTRELLFLPVPTDVKYKVKPLIDLAVYRGGTGIGGLLLLVFTNWLGLGLRGVALIAATLIVVWVAATFRMRHEFKESVKRLIGIRSVGLRELIAQRVESQPTEDLRRGLQGADEEEIVYSLGLIRHQDPLAFTKELRELLQHDSPEVKSRVLGLMARAGYGGAVHEARALLVDPDLDVRIAAMEYVCRFGTDDPEQELRDALRDDAYGIRAAAIATILRSGGTLEPRSGGPLRLEHVGEAGTEAWEELSSEEDLEARLYAARLLVDADLESERGRRVLGMLLNDPDDAVRHAALQAAALSRSSKHLPVLVDRLEVPRDRNAALRALQRRAPEIRDLLLAKLKDEGATMQQRLTIPKILRETADQETVDRLIATVPELPPQLRYEALKSLGKLRRDRRDLDFERYDVDPLVQREAEEAYLWARRVHVLAETAGHEGFLIAILGRRMEEAAERAFRALGLQHEMEDLEAAFVALRSPDPVMKQRGYELVDNALPRKYRVLFDPLLNPEKSWAERAAAAEERFNVPKEDRAAILEALGNESGIAVPWLARMELTGERPSGRLAPEEIREAIASRISLVLDEPHIDQTAEIMDIVDRADLLRKTSVFGDLRGEELAGVAALLDVETYAAGDPMLAEEPTSRLYVVVSGRAGAQRDGKILYSAGPGEILVDPAFLDGRQPETQPVAIEPTRVLVLSRLAFMRLMEERFTVVRGFMAHLAGVVRTLGEAQGGEAETAPAGNGSGGSRKARRWFRREREPMTGGANRA
jgi:AAA family ATP:ADP antiporter